MTKMLNIILADDHELIREAVKPYLLRLAPEVSIREASSYDEVLELGKRAAEASEGISLALLDLHMPASGNNKGLAGLRQVCAAMPATAVVIFSSNEDGQVIAAALSNGARGYIPKTTQGRSLVNALKLVMDGEIYVPLSMVKSVFSGQAPRAAPAEEAPATLESRLSPREAESLRLLIRGMTNKEIARELALQDVTVKLHLRNAYRKIGATNRIEAVRIALEQNLK